MKDKPMTFGTALLLLVPISTALLGLNFAIASAPRVLKYARRRK